MALTSTNPIPDILKLVPETEVALDYVLADKMIATVREHTGKFVNNHYVVAILAHLEGMVEVRELIVTTAPVGKIILIKKVYNGGQQNQQISNSILRPLQSQPCMGI